MRCGYNSKLLTFLLVSPPQPALSDRSALSHRVPTTISPTPCRTQSIISTTRHESIRSISSGSDLDADGVIDDELSLSQIPSSTGIRSIDADASRQRGPLQLLASLAPSPPRADRMIGSDKLRTPATIAIRSTFNAKLMMTTPSPALFSRYLMDSGVSLIADWSPKMSYERA